MHSFHLHAALNSLYATRSAVHDTNFCWLVLDLQYVITLITFFLEKVRIWHKINAHI